MRRSRMARLALAWLWLALILTWAPRGARAAVTPADFTDTLVATVGSPTALAFTPDGRMLITTQAGRLRVYQNGSLLTAAALDLSTRTCGDFERGMLGIAVDPQFSANGYIYIFYTFKKHGGCERNTANAPVNRVSRFTLGTSNVVDPASELVLVDNIPSPNGNHNAGDVQFGKDGNLYISIGDGGCDYADSTRCAGSNDAARDQHVLLGKVLRITPTGGIPVDNPFQGTGTARCNVTGRTTAGTRCQETYTWGLRNPFRLAFDPNAAGTRFFINDVGQNAWEEIDLGQAGADYGWNVREGDCTNGSTTNCGAPPTGMTNPVYDYGRGTGCASITAGAFVPNGIWPASYNGAYLYADYVCGKIFTLKPASGGGYEAADFVTGLGTSSIVHMAFGPSGATQALYYTTYSGGGQVRRIAYTGIANRAPTAALSASPTSGPTPLAVTFDGSGSSDPDAGDTLTYLWDVGDGSAPVETSAATTSHTYAQAGVYSASLRVRDNHGALSAAVTVRVDAGNTPPRPSIITPAATARFRVGQTLTLQGSAGDDQDGTLPPSALSWRIIQHHVPTAGSAHTHPFMPPTTGNNITFTAPAPEDLSSTRDSYLELELTATDSGGLTTVVRQRLDPQRVRLSFATQPTGLALEVNELRVTGPQTVTTWVNHALNLHAPAQQNGAGQWMVFAGWADGPLAPRRTIKAPAAATTYTARFARGGSGTILREWWSNIPGSTIADLKASPNFPASPSGSASQGSFEGPRDWGDSYGARLRGYLHPAITGDYIFWIAADNQAELWLSSDDTPARKVKIAAVASWTGWREWDKQTAQKSAPIRLVAGQRYYVEVLHKESASGDHVGVAWQIPGMARRTIIPGAYLSE